jgi:hypothetical protein
MKNVVRRTAIVFPRVGLVDFTPTKPRRIAFPQSRLNLDERTGLHLDFFDLPVVNQRRSARLPRQALKIEERVYADMNIAAHPAAQSHVLRWLFFSEDQDTDVKRPPVIPNMDHLAQSFIERAPCAG